MDAVAKLTDALKTQVQESTGWLKHPEPTKLPESMLYEGDDHREIVDIFS